MCGIAGGVWNDHGKALCEDALRRMTNALAHRGPDGDGFHRTEIGTIAGGDLRPGAALGHRRLAIIDLPHGQQPLSNEDGSVWVVFNGEIYNFLALRRRLEARGHRFLTQSDTEVIVHLYEDDGLDFLDRLDGMFALAVWDALRGRLVLARDRLGEKPLVYCEEPGRLLFASELKALLQAPGVRRAIDPGALDAYLTYQYVPHPQTIFAGISKLPPGHRAIYQGGRLDVQPYSQVDFRNEVEIGQKEAAGELRQRVTAAVEQRLQSDVPLGAFLSGGIDSTIIAALAQKLLGRPLKTFSLGYASSETTSKAYDETRFARLAAAQIGTEHHELRTELHAAEIVPRIVRQFDEPLADSSAVPMFLLAEFARQNVTAALTGDGGDELFGGYRRYQAVRLAAQIDRLPGAWRWLLREPLGRWLPGASRQKSFLSQWKRFTQSLAISPQQRYLDWVSIFNESERAWLYREDYMLQLPDIDPAEFVLSALRASSRRDSALAASLADLVSYLPCDLLTKVDMASMAHGLECRAPFLDHHVVEFAAKQPPQYRWRFFGGKRLLRQAFADLLPGPIARRRKMGFAAPLDAWFRGEMRPFAQAILFDSRTTERAYFRPEAVQRLWEDHMHGKADYSQRLWALMIFELWQREWLDR
jgi:asparagine synthase (glutamine-hydrolysing)